VATLAVLVHHDPDGLLAEHVRWQVRAVRAAVDRLVFVTTSVLQPSARAALDACDEVLQRPNHGYDFGSWRAGLLATSDWPDYDRLLLLNDSVVGPVVPVERILAGPGTDAFGITISRQYTPHLQSYAMVFGPTVLQDPFFGAFWQAMPLLDDREEVIDAYELGLARLLADLAVPLSSYFTPTAWERRLGASRSLRTFATRRPLAGAAYGLLRGGDPTATAPQRGAFSPVHMLWDRVFDDARLPVVKVAHFTRPLRPLPALRRDLERLEAAYPGAFEGFRGYVARVGGPRL
jgi:hypothetical protein